MANAKLTAGEVIEALKKHQGLAALAADSLGVHFTTIYNYRDKYPSVAEAMTQLREKRKDVVEGKLWSRINSDDTTAIIFFLKTQAKDRGYVERYEHGGTDGNSAIKTESTVTHAIDPTSAANIFDFMAAAGAFATGADAAEDDGVHSAPANGQTSGISTATAD
jgi:hypothetical protein